MSFRDYLNNICWLTDSYKVSHWLQYPPATQNVYAYFESRVGAKFSETVFFALQYYLEEFLAGPVVTKNKINDAEELFIDHFGWRSENKEFQNVSSLDQFLFNEHGWKHILNVYGGHLPVRIKAVPEGMVVPTGNVLMTIENTDPKCYWLTNYLETLLVQVWYGCTVATQSREMKKIILEYLKRTGNPEFADFKLHDFGFRGVSSVETCAVGGAAHLLNFKGTDTLPACVLAREIYDCVMAGYSIPAAEHSTINSWGKTREADAYLNMLEKFPNGLVAVVSDSYDIYNAVKNIWGNQLKDKVVGRKGTLVIRPDSGDPPKVVCDILQILWNRFGGTINEKNYRVLDDHVRIIQGDGIDFEMLRLILSRMEEFKFSADNIAFGSGGGLLQKLNRDTQRFAFKCSSVVVDGKEMPVYKNPATDPSKASKQGRLKLINYNDTYITVDANSKKYDAYDDCLETVFENGMIVKKHTFKEIRERCKV